MKITLTTGQIDMYGFLGREHHPLPSDSGLTLTVLAVSSGGGSTEIEATSPESHVRDYLEAVEESDEPDSSVALYQVFLCVTPEGRLLQIVDHEVETLEISR